MAKGFKTLLGNYIIGDSKKLISSKTFDKLRGKVNLIITSPPFPLNKKKQYGNLQGKEYKKWLSEFAPLFSELLTTDGSIVIEIGNAWNSNSPTQSTLPIESLLEFLKNKRSGLKLCQEFICYNPSRLPSPAQWVTINRIRTVDSFTRVWWMAKDDNPKADNSKILRPYSSSMKQLLKSKKFNSGNRPSEHRISEKGFLKKNGGSIMHNLLEFERITDERDPRLPHNVVSFSNTNSNDYFLKTCREKEISPHPARMPKELAAFFIQFLTNEGDLIYDPFGGSNTTGFVAESLKRRWLATEISEDYLEQAKLRMNDPLLKTKITALGIK